MFIFLILPLLSTDSKWVMYGTLQGKKSYLLFIKLKTSGETILFKRVLARTIKILGEKNNLENVM